MVLRRPVELAALTGHVPIRQFSMSGNAAHSGDEQSRPSGEQISDVDGQFTGAGPWNQIAGPEQVEKLLTREPLPTANEFVLHHSDVRCRASEGSAA